MFFSFDMSDLSSIYQVVIRSKILHNEKAIFKVEII